MKKKVLIVEDDRDISELLEIHLNDLYCEVTTVHDGKEGFEMAQVHPYDMIILDINLPRKNGLDICRDLRGLKVQTPIMMLTARSEEIDKILGLEIGADDYLTKPFSIREFIARVKALFRRIEMTSGADETDQDILKFKGLEIDKERRKVLKDGERVDLTPKEFELLYLLAKHPGKSYTRERLLSLVWGYEFNGYEHTVNSHVNRLRSKIENNLNKPKYIMTTWGIGYRFNDEF